MESKLSLWSFEESSDRARIAIVAGFATALVLYIVGGSGEPVATLTGIEYQPLNYGFVSAMVSVGVAKMLTPSTPVEPVDD